MTLLHSFVQSKALTKVKLKKSKNKLRKYPGLSACAKLQAKIDHSDTALQLPVKWQTQML